jgi:penicillin G amidase
MIGLGRHVLRGIAAVLVLVLVAIASVGSWLSTSLPQWSGRIATPVTQPVEIIRDRVGATRIIAATQDDAYFALGFAHAQDRLWQMDTYRRIGSGQVAEVMGAPGLTVDRFMRTLGLYRSAERQVESLPTPVQAALRAYARGVNAFIDQHEGPWPPEFSLLAYEPGPWHPADSLVLGKLLALLLGGNWFEELRRAALLDRLTPAEVDFLMPTDLENGPTTLADATTLPVAAADLLAAVPALIQPRRASNAWAVDGRHTDSGKPILASDPHLGLTAPGIWYLASITAPGLSMTGGTVPGMPIHLLGHNGQIAWGLTTTYGDLTDLLVLDVSSDEPARYRVGETTHAFTVRQEHIRVRLGRDEILDVRETRFGPVLSDVLDSASTHAGDGAVVVLRASALDDSDQTAAAMYALNRATDWDSFRDALRSYGAPQQNILYADTSGMIGFMAPGLVPVRRAGRGLVPGRVPDNDWAGFIPFDALPQQRGAPDGILFNANNRIVGPSYPHFISADWEPPFRAERLAEALRDDIAGGVAAHAALQGDTLSVMARQLLPAMDARLGNSPMTARAQAARAILADWSYRMDADKTAPVIFAAWYEAVVAALFDDDLGDQGGRIDPRQVRAVLTGNMGQWCDDRGTPERVEPCQAMVAAALNTAVVSLSARHGENMAEWRWGAAHPARFTHPLLSFVPGVGRWLGITVPSSGGNYTVMRGGYGGGDGMFTNGHGAGYRAVYDLNDLNESRFMVAPGTAGNPYSRYFAEHSEAWRTGATFRLPAIENARTQARGILTLVPAR